MIELNIHTDTLTDDECSALATFFATLGGEQGITSVNKSRDLPVKTSTPSLSVSDVGVEPEQMGNDLPDLSQDEPKEVKSDSLVEEQNELDVNGLPWDKRIHSGKPTKNQDGSWKKRKGVDKETFEKVAAELKGEVAETPDQSQVGFQSQTEQVQTTPDQSQVGFQSQQTQQTEESTPPATNITWPQLLQRVSAAGATQDSLNTGMAAVGMAGRPLTELVKFPEKFNDFLTVIGA